MNAKLSLFNSCINKANKIVVYGAGECGSLIIRYCIKHVGVDKIDGVIVTNRNASTPPQIMGISVLEISKFSFSADVLVIIAAMNSRIQQAMELELLNRGLTNVHIISEEEYRYISAEIEDLSASTRDLSYKMLAEIKRLECKLTNLQYMISAMPVMLEIHKKTFGPYYGAFEGKEVVVCGCGQTLNLYNFDDGRIHIGMNSMMLDEKYSGMLDYYFNQHVTNVYHPQNREELKSRNELLERMNKLECVKFIGQTIGERWPITPPYDECQIYDYNVYYNQELTSGDFWPDLRYNFLNGNVSVLFSAVQFALFCRPQKIYLVGCDGYAYDKVNYFDEEYDKQSRYKKEYIEPQMRIFYDKHVKLKEFALLAYPHTELIMVNPRGFKGIYQETATDENGYIVDL
ncbi:hypothetical protein SELR_23650 [Selenomonas ruminantium subsp. lactilytica TAM6421]|uniref:Uncharacterized protein n=1 Tax=Selenomonas ruminantium subsp. lactilytica (strain NBRC 103574 / TAM6421) TaxID=927704 RepID=I0GTI6_SELRL|nr:hypothetical protein [Selenomonas ruminantium]BAL84073.1 hypothetical protein SELR_23650 [Selenomonas ruminantium subsp. lactilytica TAM6421]